MSLDPAGGSGPREQRLLAAIVFTDVVGFSRLAAKNESRVYQALQRDLDVMTRLCQNHNGQVLNTMGDGMLLSFSSAVDAMSCALQIQRTLANQSTSLPVTEILHHRIGVHLGDVIVKGGNVFGDGVNTASRLQTHARPDSIWFSDAVHEVVKNKLKMDARYLGPRTFKNLGQTVKVWEIAPMAELLARQEAASSGLAPDLIVDTPAKDGIRGGKAAALVLASVALIVIAGVIVSQIKTKFEMPKKTGSIQLVLPTTGQPKADPAATDSGTTPDPAVKPGMSAADATNRVDGLKQGYHFDEIAAFLRGDGSGLPESGRLAQEYDSLAAMMTWLQAGLGTSSHADVVHVEASHTDYFMNGSELSKEENGSGFVPITLDTLPPKEMEGLLTALAAKQASNAPAEFPGWVSAFEREYKLTPG